MLAHPVATHFENDQAEHHRQYVEYPFLSPAAALIARQAIAADIPVLLTGEPGSGALEVARALHFFSGVTGPFDVVAARRLHEGELARRLPRPVSGRTDGGTLWVEDVHEAPPEGQHDLLALIKGFSPPDLASPVRVLASTTVSLEAWASEGRFLPELAYALATLPLPLAPLRERSADIPALVERLTAGLVARLRLEPVTYTAAAIDRLVRYLWFGNVAELAAVLGRTLALHRPRLVEPAHLVFFADQAVAAVGAKVPHGERRAEQFAAAAQPTPNLEILLGELAHELRNPMVTIKTFAQHLDAVLSDPEVRTRFSTLTSDAIARMDALLETVLNFARFRSPVPCETDLRVLFERALAERTAELTRKSVRVERNGTGTMMVAADEAQVFFALRSLLGGLIGDLLPHEPLRVTVTEAGTLEILFRADRTTAERLAAYVDERGGKSLEPRPLPFALAASLIGRNGGTLEMRSGAEGAAVITLTLPHPD
jgi:signal transduction histidine kinase